MAVEKTIDDCTKEDFARFVTAAHGLLQMAMLQYWLDGAEDKEDTSRIDAIEEMRGAFAQCGLRFPTMEEAGRGFERTLNLSPEEFFAELDQRAQHP